MARKHRDVMRVLIAHIVSGVRPAGEILPREVDLAAEFEVSRGVATATIRAMEQRAVISIKHGKGATINGPEEWDVLDPVVLGTIVDGARGGSVLAEYFERRRMLEVQAAGIAAERANDVAFERLATALDSMDETARPPSRGTATTCGATTDAPSPAPACRDTVRCSR
jgi:DNA-binding FadR family transcriptional regulator